MGVSRAILDRKLEKKTPLNYKGPCRVKKNSRHPKNIWIEPTPPTHPLPNFFLRGGGEPISSMILIFLGGFPIFCPKWPGYNHPPSSKLSLNVWIFFNLCNIPKAIPTLYSDQEETDYRVVLFIYLVNPHYTRKYI